MQIGLESGKLLLVNFIQKVMSKKVVSERVVSKKIKQKPKKSLPIISKFKKFRGSLKGLCIAPFIVIAAFVLLFMSERQKADSAVVSSLELQEPASVEGQEGLVKMQGSTTILESAEAPVLGDTLYYSYTEEEYREVEKTETYTETTVENGQEIEVTKERVVLEEEWEEIESGSEWADFSIGSIDIEPAEADLKLDYESKEYEVDQLFGDYKKGKVTNPEIGDVRMKLTYLKTDTEMIVIGEVKDDVIKSGETFIISNKDNDELVQSLESEEKTIYWVMKIASWLLLTIGIMMILSPIISLADFIPFAGKAASCAGSLVAGVISAVIVIFVTFILKFWYVFIIFGVVAIIGIALLLVFILKRKDSGTQVDK